MKEERMPHDPAYKQFFSNPEMVESLLRLISLPTWIFHA
nr:MAG TPA: putative transposase [Caudoviricetes sp.]